MSGDDDWGDDQVSTDRFSTTLYVKKMFYENEANNGGFGVTGGTGAFPGYLEGARALLASECACC